MRTRNALERLAAAAQPLLLDADSLVDAAEEERILTRIVGSDRRPTVRRRRLVVVALAAAVVSGALFAVMLTRGHAAPTATTHSRRHVALTGARIDLAGYHFRTPAGFETTSDTSCSSPGGPSPQDNDFTAAASAAGGCVEAFFAIPGSAGWPTPIPEDAVPVAVGDYQGYYYNPEDHGILPGTAGDTLYVALPQTDGAGRTIYLVLWELGLTEDQLIAVAESGLASVPFDPTTTTGTETG